MSNEDLIELLLCAADLCTDEKCPDINMEQWLCCISHARDGHAGDTPTYPLADDVKARTGVDLLFHNSAESKRLALLEAAERLREGWEA